MMNPHGVLDEFTRCCIFLGCFLVMGWKKNTIWRNHLMVCSRNSVRQVYQWWRFPEESCFQLLTEPPMFEESCFMNPCRFTEKTGQHGDAFKIVTVENDSQTIKPNHNNELQHDPISGWWIVSFMKMMVRGMFGEWFNRNLHLPPVGFLVSPWLPQFATAQVNILTSIDQMGEFEQGQVLVADMTDPDWEPIMTLDLPWMPWMPWQQQPWMAIFHRGIWWFTGESSKWRYITCNIIIGL